MNKTAFILFVLVLVTARSVAQNPQDLMQRGKQAFQQAQFAEALRYFNDVANRAPDFPELYDYRGYTLFVLGDYARAEADYTRAIEVRLLPGAAERSAVYKAQNMTVYEPGAGQGTFHDVAVLYNSRGAARYLQNKVSEAIYDFDNALKYDPGLELAKINRKNAQTGGNVSSDPVPADPDYTSGTGYRPIPYGGDRPVDALKPGNPQAERTAAENLRLTRAVLIEDMATRGGGSAPKSWTPRTYAPRKVGVKGKEYEKLEYVSAQKYTTIEQVRITPSATFVTIKVVNPELKPYNVSVSPASAADAYTITDRSGDPRNTLKMRGVQGVATYPRTTLLEPNKPLYFTLEFAKLPDDLFFINLIEGNRQSGSAWNFYNVNLSK
ncbi:MAG: hypothetical protein SF053_22230 [Bacteroidia bacterium]|nr:hypothetical protein [Bacteroidia bacterium]